MDLKEYWRAAAEAVGRTDEELVRGEFLLFEFLLTWNISGSFKQETDLVELMMGIFVVFYRNYWLEHQQPLKQQSWSRAQAQAEPELQLEHPQSSGFEFGLAGGRWYQHTGTISLLCHLSLVFEAGEDSEDGFPLLSQNYELSEEQQYKNRHSRQCVREPHPLLVRF